MMRRPLSSILMLRLAFCLMRRRRLLFAWRLNADAVRRDLQVDLHAIFALARFTTTTGSLL